MYDKGKVFIGLLIFLVVILFPVWYNVARGSATEPPKLEKSVKGDNCVLDSAWMREHHMELLDDWRDKYVRENINVFVSPDGHEYDISLSNTCLDCHRQKAEFCDRCHTYMAVDPYCWDCHNIPKEVR
jgi:hypothetical protein